MTSSSKFPRYLLGGLLIGGFWFLNRERPLWEETLRTIVVFAVVMFLLTIRLKRKGIELHLVPMIASKAVLVVLAALVESQIEDAISDPALVVSIGLGLAVTVLGPLGDSHFFSRLAPPTTAGHMRQPH
ncbi:hypothetical protein QR77_36770 [Streptomyces sp. 150FB]|uniref:hypothetical protein n=1 Tax=Streptomyces sp. 150FB TaxID=1576605 RepID=UPI0005894CA1|nr:hypothetical protein [Streptomyces sp. 150FB]KIF77883.1 hypothetical protein QR77_36770 [Streptomyces sp. 150FB]